MASVARNKAKLHALSKALNFNNVSRIISDWDETITDKDTIGLSFDLLKTLKPDLPYDQSYFFKVYMDKYDEFMTKKLPYEWYASRDTVSKEIEFQKNIKDVELSSLHRCVDLKVFEGVLETDLSLQSQKVVIKPGFVQFYETLMKAKKQAPVQFNVLSINWTGKFIENYFKSTFDELPQMTISNEFEIVDGKCTGDVDRTKNIRTGLDKLQEVQKIHAEDGKERETWYIGDSSTDVLAMIECDKGIIMKGGSAKKTLVKLGYSVYDINDNDNDGNDLKDLKFIQINDWFDLLEIYNSSEK